MNKIFDLHNDYLSAIKNDSKKVSYLKALQNVDSIISAIWTSKLPGDEAISFIEKGYTFLESQKNNLKINLLWGIEDLHFVNKKNLSQIINLNPAYCSLTWNNDNHLGGGALDGGDLTILGIDTIKQLEENNIQVDTAHLSEKSFMTFSQITNRPILCSHTAVSSIKEHKRNLKNYQLKMIAESKGLIGIAIVTDFLSDNNKSSVKDVAKHIDYIISHFNDDIVCLGTDFYGTNNLPKGIKNYENLIYLEEYLTSMGYSSETINKIFYNNAYNFFKK